MVVANGAVNPVPPGLPVLIADRYLLGSLLGRGGAAEVFKAHDQVLGHAVAVKIFLTGVAATDARRQHREIMTLAGFSHPSLVMVYNAGEHEGRAFFVMQLVEGRTLADRLHEDPCPRRILRSWVSRWPMPWPTSTDGGHPPRRQTRQRATRSARPPPPQ